jgi:hypothetical protein
MLFTRALAATGLVIGVPEGGEPAFLGTCFLFRRTTRALTAAHCVGTLEAHRLRLHFPYSGTAVRVVGVNRHPEADLAVLELEELPDNEKFAPLYGPDPIDPVVSWGDAFGSLGYPEDTGERGVSPVARCIRGYIQRFYEHRSHMGYAYRAGEMSVGAPAGLSGGPVLAVTDAMVAIGLVAENRQSTTYLHQLEEIQDGGHTYKETLHSVIQYGAFVVLKAVEEWLDVHAPKP